VAAGLGRPAEHALISLLTLNGLRVSEATAAGVEALGVEHGHRTLVITEGRQGGHRPARAAHRPGHRPGHRRTRRRTHLPDRRWAPAGPPRAGRIVRRVARRAEITITAALDAGVPLRDVQEAASHADPRTTMRYDRGRGSLDRHATYIVAAYLAGAAR
jgi:integrase